MRTCLKLSGITIAVAAATGCASLESPDPMQVVAHQAVRHGSSASDAEAQYALGKYYLGQNRTALALLEFTRAIDYDAHHVEAYNARATAFVRLGDLERAESDLARALELAPRSPHLHNNRGFVRLQRQNYTGAAESLRRAFEIDPRNDRVKANWSLLVAAVTKSQTPSGTEDALPTGQDAGLAESRAPEATASVVRALSEVLSGPVINLEAKHLAVSAPIAKATELGAPGVRSSSAHEARTRVVDLTRFDGREGAGAKPETGLVRIAAKTARAAAPTAALPSAPSAVVTVQATGGSVAHTPIATAPVAFAPAGISPAPITPVGAAPVVHAPVFARQTIATPMVNTPVAIAPRSTGKAAPIATGSIVDVAAVLRSARIEVSNGNGVRGMAAKVGGDLTDRNYRIARISNAPHFEYERTRIYFRDGYLRAALQLSRSLPVRAAIMLDNTIAERSDLRLVVGKDLAEDGKRLEAEPANRGFAVAVNGYRDTQTR